MRSTKPAEAFNGDMNWFKVTIRRAHKTREQTRPYNASLRAIMTSTQLLLSLISEVETYLVMRFHGVLESTEGAAPNI